MFFLCADIGGTNARFALFKLDNAQDDFPYILLETIELASQKYCSFIELLDDLFAQNNSFHYKNVTKCIFAVKMVQDNIHIASSTLPWTIVPEEIYKHYKGFPEIKLVNDFAAQAMACLTPIAKDFVPLFNAEKVYPIEKFPIEIIGIGTGLGSACIPMQNVLLPSEGGHQAFPFLAQSKLEQAFAHFLIKKKKNNCPTVENVLSGSGLALLHTFLTGQKIHPMDISQSAPTFKYFSIFFGRVLRNYSLTFLPKTIVLSGGIIAKNPHILTNEEFYNEFLLSQHFSQVLSKIDIFYNKNEHAALYGAAKFIK